ncbi:hypothetical protein SAMN05660216_03713 [Pseudomonas sp. LAMO17WK12:I8]|nr:hypothetical protein SAMN05660216_03713 [Pseudomonas sp. LAMO17WK12:I8]SNY31797.1 hypothetical protein SAMN05660893_03573 [Pseudomonas sp. LAMO17WK12:I12]SNY33461.1 hypothetical protein SAMN05660344_03899 [Pseudomonas sp. LAMO17WK12:I11]SNY34323.1 hypothetical protein SAMN05660700_03973 [Pseudomonas sp. LAMO17WK12:I7]
MLTLLGYPLSALNSISAASEAASRSLSQCISAPLAFLAISARLTSSSFFTVKRRYDEHTVPMPVAIDITIVKKHATCQGLLSISTFSSLLGDIIHHRPCSADSNASGRPSWQ